MNENPSIRERVLRDAERCVKCGSCKALCPTFAQDLNEGMSARGRVVLSRALLLGELAPTKLLGQRLYSCLLCGLCEPLCPVGVDVTGIIYHALSSLGAHDPRGAIMRSAMRKVLMNPAPAYSIGRIAGPLGLPFLKLARLMPFEIKLPRARLAPGTYSSEGTTRGRVGVFAGCAVSFIHPHLGQALIRVLNRMGYDAVLPEAEVCCGAPLRAMGMEDDAIALARKNIKTFAEIDAEAVVSLCPTCTLTIKKHYQSLAGEGISNAMDAFEFIATHMPGRMTSGAGFPAASIEGPVMYHEPCHLGAGLGVREAPRKLLTGIGIQVEKMPVAPPCCGFSQCMGYAGIAQAQLDACARAYEKADTIVTACPGCMAQLGRLKGKKVLHLIEAL